MSANSNFIVLSYLLHLSKEPDILSFMHDSKRDLQMHVNDITSHLPNLATAMKGYGCKWR